MQKGEYLQKLVYIFLQLKQDPTPSNSAFLLPWSFDDDPSVGVFSIPLANSIRSSKTYKTMSLHRSINGIIHIVRRNGDLTLMKGNRWRLILVSLFSVLLFTTLLRWDSSSTASEQSVIELPHGLQPYYKDVLKKSQELTFEDKCIEYFKGLEDKSEVPTFASTWVLSPSEKAANKEGEKVSKESTSKLTSQSEDLKKLITDTRVYSQCFIHYNIFGSNGWSFSKGGSQKNLKHHLSNDFGIKLFPWCSQLKAQLKRITNNGVSFEHNVPVLDKDFTEPDLLASFFQNLRSSKNGRGVVIPVLSKTGFENSLRLIKLLRFFAIDIPVQIVHLGVLSEEQESQLQSAMNRRIETSDLPLESVDSMPPGYDFGFPPLTQVWSMDISATLNLGYGDLLDKNTFNAAALLFTSFKDAILIDPSTVPTKRLFEILDSPLLKKYGAYFFGNYRLRDKVELNELKLFKELLPSDVDRAVFDMETVDLSLLNTTRFFADSRSYSTSNDVIFLDTKRYTTGLLIAVQLKYAKLELVTKGLNGDINWLSLLSSGATEAVPIHDIPVAVVGEFTHQTNRETHKSVSEEICSVHRAYLDSLDGDLLQSVLFFTNGAINCDEDVDVEEETSKKFYSSFKNKNQFLRARTNLIDIIVPKPQELDKQNDLGEVAEFISQKAGLCGGTAMCAYNIIGAQKDEKYHSFIKSFQDSDHVLYDTISRVWWDL